MSSSVRHVRLKRTFYPSEALRERICIVDLHRRRDFFFFPNEVVLKYANSALLTNSDELVIYSDSLPVVPHLEIGDKSSDKLPTRSQNGECFTQELLGACWAGTQHIQQDYPLMTADTAPWQTPLVHTLPPCLEGRRCKKAAAFRRRLRNKRDEEELLALQGLSPKSVWCEDRSTHGSLWYPSPHGHPELAGTLLHPPPPCLGIETAKPLPQKGPFWNVGSCPFRGAASCTAGWQSSARIPSPTPPGQFLSPSQDRALGVSLHTYTILTCWRNKGTSELGEN